MLFVVYGDAQLWANHFIGITIWSWSIRIVVANKINLPESFCTCQHITTVQHCFKSAKILQQFATIASLCAEGDSFTPACLTLEVANTYTPIHRLVHECVCSSQCNRVNVALVWLVSVKLATYTAPLNSGMTIYTTADHWICSLFQPFLLRHQLICREMMLCENPGQSAVFKNTLSRLSSTNNPLTFKVT